MKKNILQYSIGAIVVGGLLTGALSVFANWDEAVLPPPQANAPAPLNVGQESQAKIGGLLLNTGGASAGLVVPFGNVLFGINNGNVGIGMSDPQQKLDVNGGIRAKLLTSDAVNSNQITMNVLCFGTDCKNGWPTSSGYWADAGSGNIKNSNPGKVIIGQEFGGARLQVTAFDNTNAVPTFRISSSDSNYYDMFLPYMASGWYNPLIQTGDSGIIYHSNGFVIAPQSNTSSGLRIDANGNVVTGSLAAASLTTISLTSIQSTFLGQSTFIGPTTFLGPTNIGSWADQNMGNPNTGFARMGSVVMAWWKDEPGSNKYIEEAGASGLPTNAGDGLYAALIPGKFNNVFNTQCTVRVFGKHSGIDKWCQIVDWQNTTYSDGKPYLRVRFQIQASGGVPGGVDGVHILVIGN